MFSIMHCFLFIVQELIAVGFIHRDTDNISRFLGSKMLSSYLVVHGEKQLLLGLVPI